MDDRRRKLVFRTSSGSWAVLLTFIAVFAGFANWHIFRLPSRVASAEKLKIAGLVAGVSALGIAWFAAFRLEIDDETVACRSLFSRRKQIRRADIVRAGFAHPPRSTEGPLTFVLRTRRGDELRINLKPFPIEAVRLILAMEEELRRR